MKVRLVSSFRELAPQEEGEGDEGVGIPCFAERTVPSFPIKLSFEKAQKYTAVAIGNHIEES